MLSAPDPAAESPAARWDPRLTLGGPARTMRAGPREEGTHAAGPHHPAPGAAGPGPRMVVPLGATVGTRAPRSPFPGGGWRPCPPSPLPWIWGHLAPNFWLRP